MMVKMNVEKKSESKIHRPLKIGIAGVGVGAAEILPTMQASERIKLVAAADVNPRILDVFRQRYNGRTYPSVLELCQDPEVEAIWVATPNRFHSEHAIMAAQHGKHVVVEKPMAITMKEASDMIEASIRYNVKMVCGHTQSFMPHIRTMHQLVRSGQVGKVCAIHVWAYSDWMLRPRSVDELDLLQGGGVPFRQAPHQVDTLRLLGGGMVRSVRGSVGQWFPGRTIPGYYSAHMEFEDGTPASLMHNGYGYFVGSELVPWGNQNHHFTVDERIAVRKQLLTGTSDQDSAKDNLRIGGSDERIQAQAKAQKERKPWMPNDLGMLIVSCEHGDLRQSPFGIFVHNDQGTQDIPLIGDANPVSGRSAELDELYNAVVFDQPIRHSGQWGMATLEVCLAIMESSKTRQEVFMSHQVPTLDSY